MAQENNAVASDAEVKKANAEAKKVDRNQTDEAFKQAEKDGIGGGSFVPGPSKDEEKERLDAAALPGPDAPPTWGRPDSDLAPVEGDEKGVKALHADHLIRQSDGHRQPLSAQTEHLSATVSGDLGRVLIKVSNRGYIGEEPLVLLGDEAGEFQELFKELDRVADERLAELRKNS